ncbi:secretion protein HylD [Malaciobacter molluscorum LMG 25693]|uniref:Secretion protein HylD n=1 Tax=Malaciobacter molluscorum LMG 25693 TaxID=870501 RepID=A0A2G1DG86_9BACT|nr:HlyD family type I secretion periplasmic adaptor subunit [Malaciobacter molluscorum]AXX93477.1 type I secretion system membrane fusion protein, HlyD family [Malaciobacter molluscorum LMG 25693]PHO17509.1 secretion protein HylD [Malaciobacter molluscorum LMG 25693]
MSEQKNKFQNKIFNNFIKKAKKINPIKFIKNIYGLDENKKEDLDFVYTSYSYANEEPTYVSKIVFSIVVGVLTLFVLWASFAKIDEVAKGDGKVIPYDKVQSVQSFDGGIISEILIKEGQQVKKGDPLLKIDTTRFRSSFEENKQAYLSLMAVKVRLEAEANIDINKPIPKLEFPKEILENGQEYAASERSLLYSQYNELKSSVDVLKNQLGQKEQELKEVQYTIKNLRKSFRIIKEQRRTIQLLAQKGAKSKYDVLNIEKEYNKTSGDLDAALLSVPRSKLAIKEAKFKIEEKINTFKREASDTLQKTIGELNKVKAKLIADKDKVAKTILKSPVDGTVKQIYLNTIGGVVQSGMDLVEIVPNSSSLLVEAKIDPKDIAFINPSHKAIVKITAYDFSIYGGLDGKIVDISADSIVDKESKDQKSYYRVVVKTDKNFLEKDGRKLPIIPGMVASVDIITGKKTILDFILKPILKVKQNALTER